jgi:hypothetical protein
MTHLEAFPGWIALASQIPTDAKQALETACDNDQLLTSAEIRHPSVKIRLRAAASIIPFIPLAAARTY